MYESAPRLSNGCPLDRIEASAVELVIGSNEAYAVNVDHTELVAKDVCVIQSLAVKR